MPRINICFLFAFAKGDQASISPDDTRDLKDYGAILLALTEEAIDLMIKNSELQEIVYGKKNQEIPQRDRGNRP